MATKRSTYEIGITADTSQFTRAITSAFERLRGLSSEVHLDSQLQSAAEAAGDLQNKLAAAMNPKTNKLDLTAFNDSLQKSGKTINDYADDLARLGPDGRMAFNQVASAIVAAETPLKRTNKLMDELWTTMKNTARWQLTSTALHEMVGALETAYGYSKSLDASLTDIRIVTSKSADEMKDFAKYANQAAKALSTTTTAYTDASLVYYQQGLGDSAVKARTDTTVKMANVTGDDVEDVSQQLTSIWNNFYDGSKSLEYYVDVMVKLGATTASSSDEIADGIQKFAAVGKTVGLSYEYAASALATLTANTRESADIVGTSLRTLFSRLQGLTLGETQDDGVDLNKYSQALASIGVDILDANGELKDMDSILDEVAAKWEGLSKAQQTALAQTVGGVRQYASFINLMDNWADFETNLNTALTSEGALQEQADIYAESWEAARDRVRAAAEDIYDSLINSDFYIGLDNVLTPILTGVAKLIDGMGGLNGVLSLTAILMNKAYSDKIAKTIYDMTASLGGKQSLDQRSVTNLKQDAAKNMAKNATEMAEENAKRAAVRGGTVSIQDKNRQTEAEAAVVIANKEYELQSKIHTLTQTQAEALQAEIVQLKAKLEVLKQTNAEAAKAETAQHHASWKFVENLDDTDWASNIGWVQQAYTSHEEENKKSKVNSRVQDTSRWLNDLTQQEGATAQATVVALGQELLARQNDTTTAQLQAIYDQYKEYGTKQADKTSSDADKLARRTAIESAVAGLGLDLGLTANTKNTTTVLAKLQELITDRELSDAMVDDALKSFLAKNEGQFEDLKQQLLAAIIDEDLAYQKQDKTEKDFYNKAANTNTEVPQISWQDTIVQTGQAIAGFNTMRKSLEGITTVWNDSSLSDGEKFTAIVGSLTSGVTGLTTTVNALNAVLGVTQLQAAAIIAVVAVLYVALKAAIEEYNKAANAAKKAAEEVSNLTTAYEEAQAAAQELKNTISSWDDEVEALEDLTKGTEEYAEALKEANAQAQEMIETYGLYGSAHYNSDGLLVIDEDALEKLQADLDETERKSANALANGQMLANELQIESDIVDFKREGLVKAKGITSEVEGSTAKQVVEYLNLSSDQVKAIISEMRKSENADKLIGSDEEYLSIVQTALGGTEFAIDSIDDFRDAMNDLISSMEDAEEANEYYSRQIGKNQIKSANSDWLADVGDDDAGREELISAAAGAYLSDKIKAEAENIDVSGSTSELMQAYTTEVLGRSLDDVTISGTSITSADGTTTFAKDLDVDYAKRQIAIARATENTTFDEVDQQHFDNLIAKTDALTEKYGMDFFSIIMDAMANGNGISLDGFLADLTPEMKEQLASLGGEGIRDFLGLTDSDLERAGYKNAQAFGEAFNEGLSKYNPLDYWEKQYTQSQTNLNGLKEVLEAYANGDELSDEQTTFLSSLASQYEELNNIRDTGSHEYLKLLRSIQEQEEDNSIQSLKEQQTIKTQDIEDLREQLAEAVENPFTSTEELNSLTEQLEQAIEDVLDNDYQLKVAIEADFDSDIDQAFGLASEFEKLSSYLADGLELTYAEAQQIIADGHGAMLEGAKETANGTIIANQSVADAYLKSQRDILNADKETKITQLESERKTLVARRDSLQKQLADVKAEATAEVLATAIKTLQQEGLEDALAKDTSLIKEDSQTKLEEQTADFLTSLGVMYEQDTENYDDAEQEVVDTAVEAANARIKAANAIQQAYTYAGQAVRNSGEDGDWTYQNVELLGTAKLGTQSLYNGSKKVTGERKALVTSIWKDGIQVLLAGMDDSLPAGKTLGNPFSSYDLDTSELSLKDRITEYLASGGDEAAQALQAQLEELLTERINATSEDIGKIDSAIAALRSSYDSIFNHGESTKVYDTEDLLDLKDAEERYHDINRQLEYHEELLDDIATAKDRAFGLDALEKYDEEIDALQAKQELLKSKLVEANNYLASDQDALTTEFGNAQFGENGALLNYEALFKENFDRYQTAIERYNESVDGVELTEAEHEALEAGLEAAKERYEKGQELLSQYEDTYDTVRDINSEMNEVARSIADTALDKITKVLENKNIVSSMRKTINALSKTIEESFGDALTHGIKIAELSYKDAYIEMQKIGTYEQTLNDLLALKENAADADLASINSELESLFNEINTSAEALVEWANTIEDLVPDAVAAAADRFSEFTDALDHNVSVLQAIQELYTLQGVTAKTQVGLNTLQKNLQAQLDAQVTEAALQKSWAEDFEQRYNESQGALDAYLAAGGSESSNEYDMLVKARDAYLEQWQAAEEAQLSLAQSAMETAKQMLTNELENAKATFENVITKGQGFDFTQLQYDNLIEVDERYFDEVNEAYQVATWYNKLQQAIDEETNLARKEELRTLQKQIEERKEGNTLSQYDLDVLEAQYDVMQAQMALEDARNAKNNLQLTRDQQGNWVYRYTADQDQIADAEQKLMDAQNDYYNLAKDRVTEITGDIVDLWQECTDKIEEILQNESLDTATKEEQITAIREYYAEKATYLEQEKQQAISDLNEAGYESLKTTLEDSGVLFDDYASDYADTLDSMTEDSALFLESFDAYIEQCKSSWKNYKETVEKVAESTGTTQEEMATKTEIITQATKDLQEKAEDILPDLKAQIDAVESVADSYNELAKEVWSAVEAMRAYQEVAKNDVSISAQGYVDDKDYAAMIATLVANGYGDSSAVEELYAQRSLKLSNLQASGLAKDVEQNDQIKTLIEAALSGSEAEASAWYNNALSQYTLAQVLEFLEKQGIAFDTGGYTGSFDGGRLAWLHEKELILNQEDTNNILSAVTAVRTLGSTFFKAIESALDGTVSASLGLMGERFNSTSVSPLADTLEQNVHIEAVFPNAVDHSEIEEAFSNLTNDASQFIRRRKE